jgi:hypothetical protein
MIMRALSRRRDVSMLLLVLGSTLSTLACCSTGSARAPSGRGLSPLNKATVKCDVQVVAVLATGMTFPETVRLRRGVQIVIWAADADKLQIEFPASGNPFGTPIPCSGRFCGTLAPPGVLGSFKYTVKVTTGEATHTVDPVVIIWE